MLVFISTVVNCCTFIVMQLKCCSWNFYFDIYRHNSELLLVKFLWYTYLNYIIYSTITNNSRQWLWYKALWSRQVCALDSRWRPRGYTYSARKWGNKEKTETGSRSNSCRDGWQWGWWAFRCTTCKWHLQTKTTEEGQVTAGPQRRWRQLRWLGEFVFARLLQLGWIVCTFRKSVQYR